ncbi:MAG TPA: helix-turn-helix domain-containing protein [Egibacteraceae bacterium]|nr:helix-turn-helix domain-containing protein [Egibacteraceae bacterium]
MDHDSPSERDYPPVLDAAQVARLLNLNIDYVRKLSREGVLPAHRLPGGRTFRFFKDEVLDWLRSQPVHGSDQPPSAGTQRRTAT